MKKHSNIKRILTVMISFAVMISLLPSDATAEEIKKESVSTEIVELREECVKHFDMGDGTYQAIVYAHPVHQKDRNGNWENIDFGMSQVQMRGIDTYKSNFGGVSLVSEYTPNQPLVALTDDDVSVSMTMIAEDRELQSYTDEKKLTANTTVKLTKASYSYDSFEAAKNAKFSNKVLYENVMPNVDLEYIVDPFVVKENIVVKKKLDNYEYAFRLDLVGLYPKMDETGGIVLYDNQTHKQRYLIPVPFMYDSAGNMSFDVQYSLDKVNSSFILKVNASKEWINTEGRSFPVVIDPSVTEVHNYVTDTYISSTLPDSDLSGFPSLWIRDNRITYIRDNSNFTLPAGKVLLSAKLIGYYYYYEHVHLGALVASAHKVKVPWVASEVNWDAMAAKPNFGMDEEILDIQRAYGSLGAVENDPECIEFNITDAALEWMNGTSPNYGIALRFVEGNRSVIIKSSEATAEHRPRFTYRYASSYPVTLEMVYDQGYMNRYTGAGGRISSAVNELKDFFLDEYNIKITVSSLTSFYSYADSCGTAYNAPCTHGSDYNCQNTIVYDNGTVVWKDYHHKNIYNIIANIEPPEPETNVKMAFIGHKTCQESAALGCAPAPKGLALVPWNVMTIENHEGAESEIVTMIHEMGHMFGIRDHYGYGGMTIEEVEELYDDYSYNNSCLYGDLHDVQTVSGIRICQGCRNRVEENLRKYVGG